MTCNSKQLCNVNDPPILNSYLRVVSVWWLDWKWSTNCVRLWLHKWYANSIQLCTVNDPPILNSCLRVSSVLRFGWKWSANCVRLCLHKWYANNCCVLWMIHQFWTVIWECIVCLVAWLKVIRQYMFSGFRPPFCKWGKLSPLYYWKVLKTPLFFSENLRKNGNE